MRKDRCEVDSLTRIVDSRRSSFIAQFVIFVAIIHEAKEVLLIGCSDKAGSDNGDSNKDCVRKLHSDVNFSREVKIVKRKETMLSSKHTVAKTVTKAALYSSDVPSFVGLCKM